MKLGLVSVLPWASGQPTDTPSEMPDRPAVEPFSESCRHDELASAEQLPMVRDRQARHPFPFRCEVPVKAHHKGLCRPPCGMPILNILGTVRDMPYLPIGRGEPGQKARGQLRLGEANQGAVSKEPGRKIHRPRRHPAELSAYTLRSLERTRAARSSRNDFVAALSEQVFSLAPPGQPLKGDRPDPRYCR